MNKSTLAWLRDDNITQPEPQQYSYSDNLSYISTSLSLSASTVTSGLNTVA